MCIRDSSQVAGLVADNAGAGPVARPQPGASGVGVPVLAVLRQLVLEGWIGDLVGYGLHERHRIRESGGWGNAVFLMASQEQETARRTSRWSGCWRGQPPG